MQNEIFSFVSTVFVVTTGIELEEVCGDISDSYSDQNRCGSLDDIVRAWGGVAYVAPSPKSEQQTSPCSLLRTNVKSAGL